MHVVMVSKALVVGAYQRKAEEMARLGIRLTVLVPPRWRDRRGEQIAEARYTTGYVWRTLPVWLNGNFHLHCYPTLARELSQLQPDVLHMDEEPYNLATFLALSAAHRRNIPALFFTWQNLARRYPPPFAWWERATYGMARHALAGSQAAAQVLRGKGYGGPLTILPQFGVDPAHFAPCASAPPVTAEGRASHAHLSVAQTAAPHAALPLHIGYAGGLLPEKGLDLLLRACQGLRGAWQLTLLGEGEARSELVELAAHLGLGDRVTFAPRIDSAAMPTFYQTLDVFVLPSRTLPNWQEQFGRVLVEAMACGVVVVGSASGEIPHVIGDAGLIFPEGDVDGLRAHLQRLIDAPATRVALGHAGRARVLAHYTMAGIAAQTVAVYRQMLATGAEA
jgi:glycosyltransferase involved in cell wall biosynthesis